MRKDEIQFRGEHACVNIKAPYQSLDSAIAEARKYEELPAGLTACAEAIYVDAAPVEEVLATL